jgi:hypothetical protein
MRPDQSRRYTLETEKGADAVTPIHVQGVHIAGSRAERLGWGYGSNL